MVTTKWGNFFGEFQFCFILFAAATSQPLTELRQSTWTVAIRFCSQSQVAFFADLQLPRKSEKVRQTGKIDETK